MRVNPTSGEYNTSVSLSVDIFAPLGTSTGISPTPVVRNFCWLAILYTGPRISRLDYLESSGTTRSDKKSEWSPVGVQGIPGNPTGLPLDSTWNCEKLRKF